MTKRLCALWGLCAFVVSIGVAHAHRLPSVNIEVDQVVVDAQPITQITYQLHAGDAAEVLRQIDGAPKSLDDPAAMTVLAQYVRQRSMLSDAVDDVMLGGEVDGHFVFLYREVPAWVTIEKASILADIDDRFSNVVTIRQGDGEVDVYSFSKNGRDAALPQPHRH